MIRKNFNKLDIMKMTNEEVDLYFHIDKLNKEYILKQLENKSAAKFKREEPNAHIILTNKIINDKYKYQITFFYNNTPISHKDCKKLKEAVDQVYDYIPSNLKYITRIKTL